MEFHLYGTVTYNPGAGEQRTNVDERFSEVTEDAAMLRVEAIMSGFKRLPSARVAVQLDKLIKSDTVWRSDGGKKQANDERYF